MAPINLIQRKFHAGGTAGSIFLIMSSTLGNGTLSFAYAVMMNGYILGPIYIILGCIISWYTAMLLVRCSNQTGKFRYEDIALEIYGNKMAKTTSILYIICLIGFTFSYIVYVKAAIPQIIEMYAMKNGNLESVPHMIGDNKKGYYFWGLIYAYGILLPMSIPRNASALRFSSLVGVMSSMYLCLAVTAVFFGDKDVVPEPK